MSSLREAFKNYLQKTNGIFHMIGGGGITFKSFPYSVFFKPAIECLLLSDATFLKTILILANYRLLGDLRG